MSDRPIDLDEFGSTLEQILKDVEIDVKQVTGPAVKEGLKAGAKLWRKGAPHNRGKYKKSIRWHMTDNGYDTPTGEIGSPSMPGLPHLLEKGHARVGGGRVPAYVHIEPAAEEAFDETEKAVIKAVEGVL